MSAALHFAVLLALAFLLQAAPRGAAVEPDRSGGIVLVHDRPGRTEYFAEDASRSPASPAASAAETAAAAASLPSPGPITGDLMNGLPTLPAAIGEHGSQGIAVADVRGFTTGTGSRSTIGGQVRTSVFGVSGTGSKFVYVFDRSGSMQGFRGRPLDAAKRELIASLQSLTSVQQFQIVFYNERPHVFNPNYPDKPRLLFGEPPVLRQAERFVGGVVADGGTRHMDALRLALGMAPDVVFFLTDAAEPQLSAAELAEVRRLNRGEAVINAIEFGTGSFQGGSNFLVRLAQQNRGQHTYVDVTKLPPPQP